MNWCDFKTIALGDGRFEHVCPGYRRVSSGERYMKECDGTCQVMSLLIVSQSKKEPKARIASNETGPGTWLKRLLLNLGIYAQSGCQCDEHAATMNRWGAAKCHENIEIILGWMSDVASKSKKAFVRSQAEWLVNLAISLAEGNREIARVERIRLRAMRLGNRILNGTT